MLVSASRRKAVARVVSALVLLGAISSCNGDTGPIAIMPIGDSITHGEAGTPSYRCYLDQMLTEAGVAFDLVGTQSMPYWGTSYRCPTTFDQDHEGYTGARIQDVVEDVTASVAALQPDVALIHLGTNDLGGRTEPLEDAATLESFITGLQAVNPDMAILVAKIIPCNPGPVAEYGSACTAEVPAFNELLDSFGRLSTADSSVIVVDMETGFGYDLLRDKWHPTDDGDELMATRWMTALKDEGLI
ncbi:MAG: SGNH/GDSL hydrolase family protein [Acidimicrobiia bacterium]|nr:SGNH/GDSL hydrolase family protein [Acidimicrobiia bacterium]